MLDRRKDTRLRRNRRRPLVLLCLVALLSSVSVLLSATGTLDHASGWYPSGTNVTVTATAHDYSVFGGWLGNTNGAAISATTNTISFEVKAKSSVTAVFDPKLTATNQVPYQWLNAVLGITSGFEMAVTNDHDEDGFTTGEEYWCGTDPTNRNSLLQIDQVMITSTNVRLVWAHACVDDAIPPISIQTRASLITGEWINVDQKQPANGVIEWSSYMPVGDFFRLCVTNMP